MKNFKNRFIKNIEKIKQINDLTINDFELVSNFKKLETDNQTKEK